MGWLARWCDRLVTGGILLIILFSPLAFGSVHPWAFSIMEALLFLLVTIWMARVAVSREHGAWSREHGAKGEEQRAKGEELGAGSREPLCDLRVSAVNFSHRRGTEGAETKEQRDGAGSREQRSEVGPLALPLALFLLFCLFQLLPLPSSFLRVLSPQTYELYRQSLPGWPGKAPYDELIQEQGAGSTEQGAETKQAKGEEQRAKGQEQGAGSTEQGATWLPLSIAPELTRSDLLKLAAYAALFFLVLLYPFGQQNPPSAIRDQPSSAIRDQPSAAFVPHSDEGFFRSVLVMVLLAGLLIAVIGFLQRFFWNGKILWFFVPYDWGAPRPGVPRASGPFVNPGNFANYLALIFPIALAGALFRTFIVDKQHQAFRIFCGVVAFLLFTGMLLSLSRGGWVSGLLGVSILLWFSPWRLEGGMPSLLKKRALSVSRFSLIIVCLLLVLSLIFVGPGGREQVDTRLGETVTQDTGLWGRASVWKDTLPMVSDFPLFGVGLGAWPELFPRYKRPPRSGYVDIDVHNDYLELLAETGIVGLGLLAWFFFAGGRLLVQGIKRASPKVLPVMAGILAALGAMAFHEGFDFNLQIPANAFLFTLLFALGLRAAGSMEHGARSNSKFALRNPKLSQFALGSLLPAPRSLLFALRPLPFASGSLLLAPCSLLSSLRPSRFASGSLLLAPCSLLLCVLALSQEKLPFPPYKEPNSLAEAQELLLLHPTWASYHLSVLRLIENKAPLSWQLRAAQAGLWLDPTNPDFRDFYAAALLSMGKTGEGLSEMTRSIRDSPSLSTHVYLGDEFLPELSVEEQKAVENGFERARDRGYPEALDGLAGFYAKLGRFSDQAMLYEREALEESDGVKRARLLLKAALACTRAREEEKAELLLRQAIAARPEEPVLYHHLAVEIYGQRKDLAAAREIISSGIKNGAPPFYLYLSLAEAARKAGSPDDSKTALKSAQNEIDKAKENDGEDPYTLYLLLAAAASKVGEMDEEKAALLQALELRPRSSQVLSRLANLYLQERNFDRAALSFSTIADIDPNSADAFYRLAVAEEGRYRFADADKAYARALELAPENAHYRQRYESFKARVERNRKP